MLQGQVKANGVEGTVNGQRKRTHPDSFQQPLDALQGDAAPHGDADGEPARQMAGFESCQGFISRKRRLF